MASCLRDLFLFVCLFLSSLAEGKKKEGFYMKKYILKNWSKQVVSAFVTYQSFMYAVSSKLCPDVGRHGCEIPNLLFYEAGGLFVAIYPCL